jgi:hypothetical protein
MTLEAGDTATSPSVIGYRLRLPWRTRQRIEEEVLGRLVSMQRHITKSVQNIPLEQVSVGSNRYNTIKV